MPQRDGTAADVDLLLVDAEFFDDGQRLRRERLVQLEQVDVRNGPAGDRQLNGLKNHVLFEAIMAEIVFFICPHHRFVPPLNKVTKPFTSFSNNHITKAAARP